MVYAGAHAGSFARAEEALNFVGELSVTAERIRRATERIGRERVAERRAAVARWRALSLPEQRKSPHEHIPQVACVQTDGGRVQIWERAEKRSRTDGADSFWRETKVACLLRMYSEKHAFDPCPELPESFANIAHAARLGREIKGCCAVPQEVEEECDAGRAARPGRPQVLTRNVVATRAANEDFGAQAATRAWELGFAAAPRKVFLGDGQAANWTLWQKYFSHYTPVLDFTHALCYVYQAAAAGRPLDEVAAVHRRWAQAVWSGRVAEVIEELAAQQQQLGPPQADDAATHPRTVVAETLTYLGNQQSRMKYDEYRRQGLPITTAHIESTIKQINHRVKGSEKFWTEHGAEALLQLSADYLSDRAPLDQFWQNRPLTRTGLRSRH